MCVMQRKTLGLCPTRVSLNSEATMSYLCDFCLLHLDKLPHSDFEVGEMPVAKVCFC